MSEADDNEEVQIHCCDYCDEYDGGCRLLGEKWTCFSCLLDTRNHLADEAASVLVQLTRWASDHACCEPVFTKCLKRLDEALSMGKITRFMTEREAEDG